MVWAMRGAFLIIDPRSHQRTPADTASFETPNDDGKPLRRRLVRFGLASGVWRLASEILASRP